MLADFERLLCAFAAAAGVNCIVVSTHLGMRIGVLLIDISWRVILKKDFSNSFSNKDIIKENNRII